jgi:predicted membrane protein
LTVVAKTLLDVKLTTLPKTISICFITITTFSSEICTMPLFFLIPLCTALAIGYFFKKSSDEIAYIASVFAVISFIFSLVLAPWQIQFGLLIVVLMITNRLLQENESKQTEATRKKTREIK